MPRSKVKGQRSTVGFLAIVAAAALQWFIGSPLAAQSSQSRSLPIFEVDPAWPKVPAKWKLGDPSSFAIDAQDNVWLLHRPRTLKPEQAAMAAPPVMVFDSAGKFVKAWGGAGNGYEWPEREHGIHVDAKGFVWLGGNNCPTNGIRGLKPVADDQLLKFTPDGKFVMQIGHSNQSKGNADTQNLHRPADVWVHRRPTRCSLPTATAITASSCSMRTPASSSGCGAHSATSRWMTTTARSSRRRRSRIPGRATSASSMRCAWRVTEWSTSPIARTGASSRSPLTASS